MSGVIDDIEAFHVRVLLPRPLRLGQMVIPDRDYVIVKIRDEDGRIGWSYGLGRNAPVAETIRRTITPTWRGRNLDDHRFRPGPGPDSRPRHDQGLRLGVLHPGRGVP